MAINYDAQSKGRQLDAFSAMQTSTGVDEKLTSAPVIDAQMQPIEPGGIPAGPFAFFKIMGPISQNQTK